MVKHILAWFLLVAGATLAAAQFTQPGRCSIGDAGFCAGLKVASGGSVSIDQVGTGLTDTGTTTSFTYTGINVGHTGSGTWLLFIISTSFNLSDGTYATVSATWNGSAMTQLSYNPQWSGSNESHIYFVINSPATGSNNLVVTWAGGSCSCNRASANAYSFFGANNTLANAFPTAGQPTPFAGTGTSGSVTVTSGSGHIIVSPSTALFGSPPTLSGGSITTDFSCDNTASNCLSWAVGHAAGAASVAITASQSPSDRLLVSAVDVSP